MSDGRFQNSLVMAFIKNNAISGLIGPVVSYNRKGVSLVRSQCPSIKDHKSVKQLAQRMRMKLANNFLSSFKSLVKISYGDAEGKDNAYNRAKSMLLKETMVGNYPDISIDCSLVRMSHDPVSYLIVDNLSYHDDALTMEVHVDPAIRNRRVQLLVVRYCEGIADFSDMLPLSDNDRYNLSWGKLDQEHGPWHFWLMLYDPLSNHCYGSVYRYCPASK